MPKRMGRSSNACLNPEIIKWTLENRHRLLGAILTIVRGWVCAGRPEPEKLVSLGGYETYIAIMGSILHFIGADSFASNLDKMYDEVDQDTPQWQTFFEYWHELVKKPVTANELIQYLNSNSEFKETLPDAISDTTVKNYQRRLGIALSKKKDMQFPNGVSLKAAGEFRRSQKWQIVSLKNEDSHQISLNCESCESSTTLAYARENNLHSNRVVEDSHKHTLVSKECESLKNNSEKSDNSGQLPDCPKCGQWDWTFNPEGQPVCSCGCVMTEEMF